jgi:hypothetical protein
VGTRVVAVVGVAAVVVVAFGVDVVSALLVVVVAPRLFPCPWPGVVVAVSSP